MATKKVHGNKKYFKTKSQANKVANQRKHSLAKTPWGEWFVGTKTEIEKMLRHIQKFYKSASGGNDKKVSAKKPGARKSKSGNTYSERRVDHSDIHGKANKGRRF